MAINEAHHIIFAFVPEFEVLIFRSNEKPCSGSSKEVKGTVQTIGFSPGRLKRRKVPFFFDVTGKRQALHEAGAALIAGYARGLFAVPTLPPADEIRFFNEWATHADKVCFVV